MPQFNELLQKSIFCHSITIVCGRNYFQINGIRGGTDYRCCWTYSKKCCLGESEKLSQTCFLFYRNPTMWLYLLPFWFHILSILMYLFHVVNIKYWYQGKSIPIPYKPIHSVFPPILFPLLNFCQIRPPLFYRFWLHRIFTLQAQLYPPTFPPSLNHC